MNTTAWVLTMGATYRATLLVTSDEITRPPRDWFLRKVPTILGVHGLILEWVARMIVCPWCASVWLAAPIVGSGLAWSPGWGWQLATGALTASGFTGAAARYAAPD